MLSSRKILLFSLALLLVVAPLFARVDELTGPLGHLVLESSAAWTGSAWAYDYHLFYDQGGPAVHVFAVGNPAGSAYFNSANTDAFINPVFDPMDPTADLQWDQGWMQVGQHVYFHYESLYAPDVVPVNAVAYDGGTWAEGVTLGMSNVIPEPGCIASLAGLVGMSGFYLRRARRR